MCVRESACAWLHVRKRVSQCTCVSVCVSVRVHVSQGHIGQPGGVRSPDGESVVKVAHVPGRGTLGHFMCIKQTISHDVHKA